MTDNLPATIGVTLEQRAQAHENEAIALYVETMRNADIKIEHRLKAADSLLDRARGKPRQPQQTEKPKRDTKAVRMSVATLLKIVQKASENTAHRDAIRAQAKVLEGEFVPVVRKRPVNEYAALTVQPPREAMSSTSAEVDDLLK